MSAGLLTSTCTPGRTAPDVSLTTPAMLLCADVAAGSRRSPNDDAITSRAIRVRLIEPPSVLGGADPPYSPDVLCMRYRHWLREPRRRNHGVRLHVVELDLHLHVGLCDGALKRHLHPRDVAVVGVIHLRRNESDRRSRPAHEPYEQPGVVEVEVGQRLRFTHSLDDSHLFAVDCRSPCAPPWKRLLDRGGEIDDRLESRAIQIAFGERQE